MKKFVLFFILFLSAGTFAQEKEIIKVLETQQKAWNEGNLEVFMEGYWKSDSLLFVGSKGPTYGWQPTLDNYKKSYPGKAVTMLGKNYASVFGRWKLTREKDTPEGIYTLDFRKFKNGWKIISDHSS